MSFGWYVSSAPEEKPVVVVGSGHLQSLFVANVAPAARWVWVFDAADVSGALDANIIFGPYPLAAGGAISIDLDPDEVRGFKNGLVIASATSGSAYTGNPSSTADLRVNANTQKSFGT
jgi:hypothetical protein